MRRTVSSDSPAVMLDSLLPYVTVALPVTLLCVWNLDFPLGYHGDEVKKVGFVKSGTADFHHPLLLLQLTGLTSRGLGSKTDTEIVLAGRIVSVISAAGTALWTLWHGRRLLPKCWAWWSACTASVTPLVVMHAHYMKEDMLLTFLSLLALRPLSQLARRCQFPYAILFGIFAGLASSSHYKGCLLFIVASVLPLCAPIPHLARYWGCLLCAAYVAFTTFAAVHYSASDRLDSLAAGAMYEIAHATLGHDIIIRPYSYGLAFHAVYSILPGLGVLLTFAGVLGLIQTLWLFRRNILEWRVLALFAGTFYLVPELSPLKPFPDFARYMVPLAAPMALFAGRFLWLVTRRIRLGARRAVALSVCSAIAAPVLYDTTLLVFHIRDDTRAAAARIVASLGAVPFRERHADSTWDASTVAAGVPEHSRHGQQEFTHYVCSSFQYDRYFHPAAFSGQPDNVASLRRQYSVLFARDHITVRPVYRSYAFSNPTIKIIPILSGDPRSSGATLVAPR